MARSLGLGVLAWGGSAPGFCPANTPGPPGKAASGGWLRWTQADWR